jgi:hypothetical protein
MGEKGSGVRAVGRAVGRSFMGALVWFVCAGSWLWTAIVSDDITGPYFFLHLSGVCLCLAAAAHCWTSFRYQTRQASQRHYRP